MPCNTIVLNRVEMPKMRDDLLMASLTSLGATGISHTAQALTFTLDGVRCTLRDGQLIVPKGKEHLADRLKQGYSVQVVKFAAAKAGWALKQTAATTFAVQKRR